jgi:hypothetical protein
MIFYFGKMTFWQSNTLAKLYFDQMISWDTHWPLSKQTLFKANDFATWFTRWPQIEWL